MWKNLLSSYVYIIIFLYRIVTEVAVGVKRGSDELLSGSVLSSPNSNMSGMVVTANGNDSKKFKGEDKMDGAPSRVLHIRKLPGEVTETEVIALGLPFGKVTNILMLKGKTRHFWNWQQRKQLLLWLITILL